MWARAPISSSRAILFNHRTVGFKVLAWLSFRVLAIPFAAVRLVFEKVSHKLSSQDPGMPLVISEMLQGFRESVQDAVAVTRALFKLKVRREFAHLRVAVGTATVSVGTCGVLAALTTGTECVYTGFTNVCGLWLAGRGNRRPQRDVGP